MADILIPLALEESLPPGLDDLPHAANGDVADGTLWDLGPRTSRATKLPRPASRVQKPRETAPGRVRGIEYLIRFRDDYAREHCIARLATLAR